MKGIGEEGVGANEHDRTMTKGGTKMEKKFKIVTLHHEMGRRVV